MKKYSIVIPTYNHCDDLLRPCIESILKYTDLNDAEIIISANGCTDNTREYLISLGNIINVVWNDTPLGYVTATNLGIQHSSGQYVVLLNNDTVLLEQPINEWLEILNSPFTNQSVGITGPQRMSHNTIGHAECIVFFCAMIRRSLIETIGLLDDAYSPGGIDDFDFCQRAMRSNYSLYTTPDVKIIHKAHQTFNVNSTKYLHTLWRNEQYFRDKFGQIDDCLSDKNFQKNNQIKYSIVIPTYNHCDDLLRPCIDSILTYTDLTNTEVVISANGCTDNTREYLLALADEFKNLGFEHHLKVFWSDPALGYSKATNEGIKISIGKYIVLLNNDTVLLTQEKNTWLNILTRPFDVNSKCGITSVVNAFSEPAGHDFAIFFCVMIDREVFNTIGLLNEYYGKGGGEDTEFCIEAKKVGFDVCQALDTQWSYEIGTNTGYFPIYHRGEGTVHDATLVPDWSDVFFQNSLKLAKKYNKKWFNKNVKSIAPTDLFWLEYGSASHQHNYNLIIKEDRVRIISENLNDRDVVDIGAKSGIFSILAASKGAANVFAIEPLTKNYRELCSNSAYSNFFDVIRPIQKFVGNKSVHHLEFLKTKSNNRLDLLEQDYTTIGCFNMSDISKLVKNPNAVLKVDCDGCEYDLFLNSSYYDLLNFSYIILQEYQDLNPVYKNYEVLEKQMVELGFYMEFSLQGFSWMKHNGEKLNQHNLPFKTTFWRRRG